jgi:UDP:flavonoid glycosyltransferase YjiC (YdhE family)
MMRRLRIVFSSSGLLGHVHPLVPLARALGSRGHVVRWAIGPDGCAGVEQAGFEAVAVGLSRPERLAELVRRYPEFEELPPDEQPDFMFGKVFGEIAAPAMFADLLPLVESWQPQLIVNDGAELAAPIAARVLSVPHVTHAFGALLPEALTREAGEAAAGVWQAHGLEPRPYGGLYDHLYLDIYPPSLQPFGGEHIDARQLLRPVAFAGITEDGVRTDITERTGRPLVYLTFGTVFEAYDVFAAALAGIRELGVGLVVTVGHDRDPADLGPQPAHVVVERYIPQTQLLPACDLVVSHAGSGTTLAALATGVPQLCLPQRADQFVNAAAVAGARAGLMIHPAELDATAVARASRQLLEDPSFGRAARIVAHEIALMPSPEDVTTVLERLVEP